MKKALGVFTILEGISLVVWIVILLCTFQFAGTGTDYLTSLVNFFRPFGNVFANLGSIGNPSVYGIYGYVTLVLFVIFLVLVLLWIILLGVKKKPIYLSFLPIVLLGLFPLLCTVANFDAFLLMFTNGMTPETIVGLVIYSLLFAYAVLTTLLFVVFYILGIANILKRVPTSETKELPVDGDAAVDASYPYSTVEAPVMSVEEPTPEPAPTYVEGVEPEGEPAQHVDENNEPTPEPAPTPAPESVGINGRNNLDAQTLAQAIRDAVRDIVRDELARAELNKPHAVPTNSNSTITGATFGGPLVVQYFNGGINSVPAPEPKPVEQPVQKEEKKCEEEVKEEKVEEIKEEPVVEEPTPEPEPVVEEPTPEPEPVVEEPVVEDKVEETVVEETTVVEEPTSEPEPVVEEPTPEPEPVVEEPVVEPIVEEPTPEPEPVVEEPVVEPVIEPEPVVVEEKPQKVYERISFIDRMIDADKDMQDNYNILKNEILSYGVKSRVSNSGDTFRLHKKTYVKITIAGKSLKLYFALDPKDYENSTMPVQDAGHKGIYAEIPLVFKVRSELSMRRCKDLIQTVMEKDHLEQGEILDVNWIEDLKSIALEKDKEDND